MIKIIISPAKKMKQDTDTFACHGLPVFLQEAEELKEYMRSLSYQEAKNIWRCNDKIADLNYKRFAQMDLQRNLTPALLAYEGIQYQYMAPAVFEDQSFQYVKEHLCILSGFYGMLGPFDGVVPYRLEMQAKIHLGAHKNLYDYWGDKISREVCKKADIILNLASKEYSKCISSYLPPGKQFLTCRFGEFKEGKVVETGTKVKMARGEMVRFLAQNEIEDVHGIKNFHGLGYQYEEGLSDKNTYVFLKG
ncbi:hypothetical protein C806_01032 [Lachnospiraceae bacterium 3-1]|nr:hypothetical protein C806_01032 [Lachnospiraceae bacterium 3-1]